MAGGGGRESAARVMGRVKATSRQEPENCNLTLCGLHAVCKASWTALL